MAAMLQRMAYIANLLCASLLQFEPVLVCENLFQKPSEVTSDEPFWEE